MQENIDKYEDMIHMDYKGVQRHSKMSLDRRAAQFSKFAALGDNNDPEEIPEMELPAKAEEMHLSK